MDKEVEKQYENVNPKLKDLWDVEMDLLSKFAEVCQKHDLKWFADGGTLLGAVRHKGFIPWDDDIDIIMPYDDYCKIIHLAAEFDEPYFLQTYKTNEGSRPFLCRLRRSDTTGYSFREHAYPKDWNKGVFIDIFAMCNIPDNPVTAATQKYLFKSIRTLYFGFEAIRDGQPAADNKLKDHIIKGLFSFYKSIFGYQHFLRLLDTYVKIGGWGRKNSKLCAPLLFRPYAKNLIWQRNWYKDTIIMDFMDISVPCPSDYESRLSSQYGDYMTPIKQSSFHGDIVYDLKVPYKMYHTSAESSDNTGSLSSR